MEPFAPAVAAAFRQAAAELDAALAAESAVLLSLSEAARVTGYSADHFSPLIRVGKLQNYGRKHAPRVRLAELPRKPGYLPPDARVPHVGTATRRDLARAVVDR